MCLRLYGESRSAPLSPDFFRQVFFNEAIADLCSLSRDCSFDAESWLRRLNATVWGMELLLIFIFF